MKKSIKNLATKSTYTVEVLSYNLAVSLNILPNHTPKELLRYLFGPDELDISSVNWYNNI
jgi:hypothetical protein